MTRFPLASVLVATLLAGCQQEPQLRIDQAWVRLAPTPRTPSAAYFIVHGGPTPARLVSVTSSVAVRTEMHDTMRGDHGAMRMTPLQAVDIPARGEVRFAPGGRHVMIFNINPGVKPGRAVPLLFTFADSTRITVDATSQPMSAPPPDAE